MPVHIVYGSRSISNETARRPMFVLNNPAVFHPWTSRRFERSSALILLARYHLDTQAAKFLSSSGLIIKDRRTMLKKMKLFFLFLSLSLALTPASAQDKFR